LSSYTLSINKNLRAIACQIELGGRLAALVKENIVEIPAVTRVTVAGGAHQPQVLKRPAASSTVQRVALNFGSAGRIKARDRSKLVPAGIQRTASRCRELIELKIKDRPSL
jgi:hypothetical protein